MSESEGGSKEVREEVALIGRKAKEASRALAKLSSEDKNLVLNAIADELQETRLEIKKANAIDLAEGEKSGLTAALLDRLELTDGRIDAMIQGLRDVANLSDPVGRVLSETSTESKLNIQKVRSPIGVVAIIYESRPNVTADAAALCFKASNAVILKGGKEAKYSNAAIADAMMRGGAKAGLPENAIQLIRSTDREAVKHLVQLVDYVDLAIPRGGEGLINAVTTMAHVPVIKHYKGVCHVYVDGSADLDMAVMITENAKCQRPGVCNAIETLLVHESIAAEFLPKVEAVLLKGNVELRGDDKTRKIIPNASAATEDDWYEEYLDLILSIRVVDSVDDAIDHVNKYGSHHSDAIVAESAEAQEKFLAEVDSSCVYVNTSTRFTDGAEFGLGAEIGISTDKLHARGPMGVDELTTYKFLVRTDGVIRT